MIFWTNYTSADVYPAIMSSVLEDLSDFILDGSCLSQKTYMAFIVNAPMSILRMVFSDYPNILLIIAAVSSAVVFRKPTIRALAAIFRTFSRIRQLSKRSATLKAIEDVTKSVYESRSGIKFSIRQADLLAERVDAIVCATSSDLNHKSGLAKDVAMKVGRSLIDRECRQILNDSSRSCLDMCEAVHTTAGKLRPNIKFVIHVVCPMARSSTSQQSLQSDIYMSYLNCLHRANNVLKVKSISFPALCTGHFGAPVRLVAKAAFEATVTFQKSAKQNMFISEVNFVIPNSSMREVFESEFNTSLSSTDGTVNETSTSQLINKRNNRSNEQLFSDRKDVVQSLQSTGTARNRERRLKQSDESTNSETSSHIYRSEFERHEQQQQQQQLPDADSDQTSPGIDHAADEKEEDCVICMCPMCDPRQLTCGHKFCKQCIQQSFDKCGPKCPSCGKLYGIQKGNQPPGTMTTKIVDTELLGHSGYNAIEIEYIIPDGIQNDSHPNPGQPFQGVRRVAYLPDNPEGREVLELLKKAFDAKLTFTVGRSVTTGADNVVVWNDIHHKTGYRGPYGYPDPTYLTRVKAELAAKGIDSSV